MPIQPRTASSDPLPRPHRPSLRRATSLHLGATLISVLLAACGGGGSSGSGSTSTDTAPLAQNLALLTGSVGGPGNLDGAGSAARFNTPSCVARLPGGDLLVCDSGNHRLRRVTPQGEVSTYAGSSSGYADGDRQSAQFNNPAGLAVASDGTVYVADSGNAVIRKISPGGQVSTLAGTAAQTGLVDGQGSAARFGAPGKMILGRDGALRVLDGLSVRRVDTGSGNVSTLPLSGLDLSLVFSWTALAERSDGTLVLGSYQGGVVLRDADGRLTPWGDGGGSANQGRVTGLSYTASGDLLLAVAPTAVIRGIYGGSLIRKITPAGQVSTLAGAFGERGHQDGGPGLGRLCWPTDIAALDDGHWAVTDGTVSDTTRCNTVRRLGSDGSLDTLAGAATQSSDSGTGDSRRLLSNPTALVSRSDGLTAVADRYGIQRISADGTVSAWYPYRSDTTLDAVIGLALDSTERVCFTLNNSLGCLDDSGNATALASSDGSRWTVGSGDQPAWNGLGNKNLAPDRQGGWWVASGGNLWQVSATGDARVRVTNASIFGLGTGSDGRVYAIEQIPVPGQSAYFRVLSWTAASGWQVLAGSATQRGLTDGSGAAATFTAPSALAVDARGYVYVADSGLIRAITPQGLVYTLAGARGQLGVRLGTGPGSLSDDVRGLAVAADQRSLLVSLAQGVLRITLNR